MKDYRSKLDAIRISEVMEFANALANKSRTIINNFGCANYATVYKPDEAGPVTMLDYEVEDTWRSLISKRFPDHGIVGEETGATNIKANFHWLLDPIDGTDDLVRGIPLFGSIIAVLYRGFPIVGVIDHPKLSLRCAAAYGAGSFCNGERLNLSNINENNLAELIVMPAFEDFRLLNRSKSTSALLNDAFPNQRIYRNVYGHTLTIAGKVSACIEVSVQPWDIAATQLLIEEAQGKFVSLEAGRVDYNKERISVVFGRKSIINQIVSIIQASPSKNNTIRPNRSL